MDIAVVGFAFRLPRGIDSRRALWGLLEAGESAVGALPPGRWQWPADIDPLERHPGIDRGGFLSDAAAFDAEFFQVSPRDAQLMDPQQRIGLELAWACLEDAGYAAGQLAGSSTGVFLGASGSDYRFLTYAEGRTIGPKDCLNTAVSLIPNRISHFLDLRGPSVQIDTACSGSLVAIHEAMQSLRTGRCDGALVGAAHVMCHPGTTVSYYKAGMLAKDGRCKTFDAHADGFVRSEGIALLFLKRLADAQRDGDRIHALLKGSAVNHGGMAGGVTVPNARAQSELIAAALRDARLDASSISYVEAHGSGTALGDPIEFEGLCGGLEGARLAGCGLGSVKSNLGHLEAAAGMAGLLKVLLSLERRMLPPSINCQVVNPKIRFEGSPFHRVDRLMPWTVPEGQPRRAGVNSFGWGGTNGHVIVEEYLAQERPAPVADSAGKPLVFVLSARNEQRLTEYAASLLDYLETSPAGGIDLASVAYTLEHGREPMQARLAIRACSLAELAEALRARLEGRGTDAVASPEVDSARRYEGANRPTRVPLPTYPFARDPYWICAPSAVRTLTWERMWVSRLPPRVLAKPVEGMRRLVLLAPGIGAERIALSPGLDCQMLVESICGDMAERIESYAVRLFEVVRRLLLERLAEPVVVQVVIDHEDVEFSLAGLLRSAHEENPLLLGQVIGLDVAAVGTRNLQRILDENLADLDAVEIRYVDGERQVLGCVNRAEVPPATVGAEGLPWRDGGVYWITGGAGGLGRLFAQKILRTTGDARVILTGRSKLDEQGLLAAVTLSEGSVSTGGVVEYRVLDVTDADAVERFVAETVATVGNISGIIHAAGVSHDDFTIRKSVADFRAVLAPKVRGTINIDRATSGLSLDFFLLCSSMMGALGNVGQTDYALANEFQTHFATWRSQRVRYGARQGVTLSVAWPLWAQGGMDVDRATSESWVARGFYRLPTDCAFAALGNAFSRAASGAESRVLVLHGVPAKLDEALRADDGSPDAMGPRPVSVQAPREALRLATLGRLKELLAQITQWDARKIDPTERFEVYGIDSIGVTEANEKLSPHFPGLPKTLFFEHANLVGVCDYLTRRYPEFCGRWTGIAGSEPPPAPAYPQAPAHPLPQARPSAPGVVELRRSGAPSRPLRSTIAGEPVAIVGLAGHYPQAHTLDQFWDNLRRGLDCIREIPPDRWSLDGFYDASVDEASGRDRSYSKWGGFLEHFAEFDAGFFGISPRDALGIDPQERLFLQTCWEAMEDAGYTRRDLARRYQGRVGVFAGVTKTGFELYRVSPRGGRSVLPRTSFSSVANRVSHWLDLSGPSMPIDTMCSASLTAVHEACEHLLRGDCELAIAGGVNLYLHPSTYVDLCGMRMLSADGKCRSFGKDAAGFVPGEGVGVVWLKRLTQAQADGDRIHAVIRGTSINHGGHTNGYTVPNPAAQRDLIRATLSRAGVEAHELSYVEAHGTGTALGDPIEISGLTQAFAAVAPGSCAIGSVKSNIGHLEAAAGIAGLTKVVLQMRHQMLVPSLHARESNPNLDFASTPFVVQQELAAWRRPVRIAGVAAFGAGGANAYAILEEYREQRVDSVATTGRSGPQPLWIVLSARTQEALQRKGQQLLEAIGQGALREQDLPDMVYTLQVGREAMECRLALDVRSLRQLQEKLTAAMAGELPDSDCRRGQVARSDSVLAALNQDEDLQAAVSLWMEKGKLARLAELWTRGLEVDWRRLYDAPTPRIKSLPTYPFARDRYWFDSPALVRGAADVVAHDAMPVSPPEAASAAARATTAPAVVVTPSVAMAPAVVVAAPVAVPPEVVARPLTPTVPRTASQPIVQLVLSTLKAALYLEHEAVELDQPFSELGLDSVIGVEWLSKLSRELGLSLSATRLYEYPTVRALSTWLSAQLPERCALVGETLPPQMPAVHLKALASVSNSPAQPAAAPDGRAATHLTPASAREPPPDALEPIAIIGMSGRYPLAADLAQFWDNLRNARDCVREIPPERFDVTEHYDARPDTPGKIDCKWLGSIDDIDCFDPQHFHISPTEAAGMDPQQRLILQESYHAFEDAGYSPQRLSNRACGVYLGIMGSEYSYELLRQGSPSRDTTGTSAAIAAGRIAYYLNLKGPALAIDTACSSSLVALHLGCQGLRSGEISLALVGGVTLYLGVEAYRGMCAAGMLSRSGRCRSFDQEADGFVPGEGVGAVVLKRLKEAQADGDRILGVIVGSGINQDGKTNGLTAPSVSAQRELLEEVYSRYGIDPSSIGYVEAHGTGTRLGDPVELQALREVYGAVQERPTRCGLGSVKSNIGHTSAAAGIAGMHKVLLCLQHRQWVPSLHYQQANEHLELERTPFEVITACREWPKLQGQPRRAGISSFGYSGTNAHVVIEEYESPVSQANAPGPVVVVLSGRTPDVLRRQVENLLTYLQAHPQVDLQRLAYTLQVGREAFTHRAAFVTDSAVHLTEQLQGHLHGEATAPVSGEAVALVSGKMAPQPPSDGRSAHQQSLARQWLAGDSPDWLALYDHQPGCLPLPTYPFEKVRCWMDTSPTQRTVFLTKQWQASRTTLSRALPGHTGILCNEETHDLALSLAARLPNCDLLTAAQLETDRRARSYDAWIDLMGCGTTLDHDMTWLSALQQWLDEARTAGAVALQVTRGLEALESDAINLAGADRVGLYRMLSSEYANIRSRHLDVDERDHHTTLIEQILDELRAEDAEVEVCYRRGTRYRARLAEAERLSRKSDTAAQHLQGLSQSGVLWITGGTRGIGSLTARHLASAHGVKRLLLTGKEPLPPREDWASIEARGQPAAAKIAALRALEAEGVQVLTASVDLTDKGALRALVLETESTLGPIAGVIHSAGAFNADTPALIRKSLADVRQITAPKIEGLDNLLECIADQPVKFVMLYSSIAAAVPCLGVGQGDYAMANAYMDYVALARSARGAFPVVSIQWPNWRETGFGATSSDIYRRLGFTSHSDAQGLQLLERLLTGQPAGVVAPVIVDPQRWNPDRLLSTRSTTRIHQAQPQSPPQLEQWLTDIVAAELRIAPADLDPGVSLQHYGADSVLLAQALRRIGERVGETLDPSVLYEHPTIHAFAQWLAGRAHLASEVKQPRESDIAVVGLSCRFPGCTDPDGFWEMLVGGRSAIGPIPTGRWGHDAGFHAAFLQNATRIDPELFHISPDDAAAMDPQAVALLEETLNLLCRAGYPLSELKGQPIGVYIGARALAGANTLATHISRSFDLRGPSVVVDTACSSALVAMSLAIQALRSGEIESALVGGVSLLDTDAAFKQFARRGILSRQSQLHLFDRRADGAILGEGAGLVWLKSVERALRDGDPIHAVVKAVAVNNDGQTPAAAPNFAAQQELMQTALRRSGCRAGDVCAVEVSGSGSEINDLLELKAIRAVYRDTSTLACELGSCKPNIGHLLTAAGMASLIKATLMLRHRSTVPFLSAREPMAHFDFRDSPLCFSRERVSWSSPRSVVAVNSFADGGTNAHSILESWNETRAPSQLRRSIPLPTLKRRSLHKQPPLIAFWEKAG